MEVQYLDRSVRLPSTMQATEGLLKGNFDDWEMNDAERSALLALVTTSKPQAAIEVGVYKGGSLAILAGHCRKVYALDVDSACAKYAQGLTHVEFILGPSQRTLPELVDRIQLSGEPLDFVLIDAAHTEEGVRADIESVLRYRPQRPLYIVMHDSFNPACRKGIREAAWSQNPHVHMVELDFTPGRFVSNTESPDHRQMWNGFALAILLPQRRTGDLVIHENESLLFQTALRHSVYKPENWWSPLVLIRRVRRAAYLLRRDHSGLQAALKKRLKWQS